MPNITIPPLPHLLRLGRASSYLEEIEAVLGPLAVFNGFSSKDLNILCDYMECYAASTGTAILKEGDTGDFMMLVLTGNVTVTKLDPTSGAKVVSTVEPGGFLGEMSLLDGMPRSATCTATAPTDLAVFDRTELTGLVADQPEVGAKVLLLLLQILTQRLRATTERLLPAIEANWV